MPFASDEQLAEIRSRADIVQVIGERVPLKRAGHNFKGLCPFHGEKTPSFMVHPEKQIFHCFGCSEGGDVFSFLMKFDGVDFGEAVRTLAERYGVTLTEAPGREGEAAKAKAEKDLLHRINKLAIRFFYDSLQSAAGSRGRDYLEKRDIKEGMIREAYLGYAPGDGRALLRFFQEKKVPLDAAERLGLIRRGNSGDPFDFFRDRLICSVVSPDDKVLGFSGRALSDEQQPKYLNSPESAIYKKSETLLGLHMAREAIRESDQAILVEGNFDMIRLHQEGIRNVVAPLGTALTERQVRYLKRFTDHFVLIFDGDAAGLKASERALEIFLPLGVAPKVVHLPKGEDPDSFVRQKGPESLREMINNAPALLDVRMEHIFEEEGKDPQGQAKAVRRVAELLAKVPGEIEKSLYLQRVASRFGLSIESLARAMRTKGVSATNGSNFLHDAGDQSVSKLPPIERTVLEVLLAGHANPAILLEQIEAEDFSHPALSAIWKRVKEEFRSFGRVDLAKILSAWEDAASRGLLTELAMAGNRWKDEGGRVAEDCLRQLRTARMRDKLKTLSKEIRQAENGHDAGRMKELIDQKNQLIKQMTNLH
ncbi:MAG TPA: DNA primase [bacterium]|nr:DNA primase [bacterium]